MTHSGLGASRSGSENTGLTPKQEARRAARCRQLSSDIRDIKRIIRDTNAKRGKALATANDLTRAASLLADKEFRSRQLWDSIGIIADLFSAGSSRVFRKAAGDLVSALAKVAGLSNVAAQVNRMLKQAELRMKEFERLGVAADNFNRSLKRLGSLRSRMGCPQSS